MVNAENQDAVCHGSNRKFCAAALADGVSTCAQSRRGAEIAVRTVLELFLDHGERLLQMPYAHIAQLVLERVMERLTEAARSADAPVEEFSSTLSAVLYEKKTGKLLYFHLGDGMILYAGSRLCGILCRPSDSRSGCVVTTTKHAELSAAVEIVHVADASRVMLCSDGMWPYLFMKNRLHPDFASLMSAGDHDTLCSRIADNADDSSYIAMELAPYTRRKRAV